VNNKERRKLLGQVKHSIAITLGSTLFGEVMQAAWNDFNNPELFTRNKDVIVADHRPAQRNRCRECAMVAESGEAHQKRLMSLSETSSRRISAHTGASRNWRSLSTT